MPHIDIPPHLYFNEFLSPEEGTDRKSIKLHLRPVIGRQSLLLLWLQKLVLVNSFNESGGQLAYKVEPQRKSPSAEKSMSRPRSSIV